MYRNYYKCPYDWTKWDDEWDCTCNDRCPTCNREIEPWYSEDLEEDLKLELVKVRVALADVLSAIEEEHEPQVHLLTLDGELVEDRDLDPTVQAYRRCIKYTKEV